MTANAFGRSGNPDVALLANPQVRQLLSFGAIGVASTLAYVAIYAGLRTFAPAAAANVTALVMTAIANTAANRRLTFGVHGSAGLARDHAAGLVALVVALALTSASLGILELLAPRRGRLLEIAVLVAANAAATFARFVLLRVAIQRNPQESGPYPAAPATLAEWKRNRG